MQYVGHVFLIGFIWIAVFSYLRLYRPAKVLRRTDEVWRVLFAHAVATLCLLAINYFLFSFDTRPEYYEYDFRLSRAVIGIYIVLSAFYFVGSRLLVRNYLRNMRRQGHFAENVLIVGSGKTAQAIVDGIGQIPELGANLIGCLANQPDSKLALPLLGGYGDILKVIEGRKVDRIIIALPREDAANQNEILGKLNDATVDLHIVPDLYEYLVLGCGVETIGDLPFVTLNNPPIGFLGVVCKRLMDVTGALVFMAVFSPLYLVLALMVKLTSRGPVFYGQERMGMDGQTFTMWKFRSMVENAEAGTGAVWAKENDDRRTPVGKFLRQTSLDEIPQFFNVLMGDMSLVGPRPERPNFVCDFRSKLPSYMLRHKMKAGITGWAQINGWRGNTSLEKRLESDLYYIQNWSLMLDLKILLLTPLKGFVNKNAY